MSKLAQLRAIKNGMLRIVGEALNPNVAVKRHLSEIEEERNNKMADERIATRPARQKMTLPKPLPAPDVVKVGKRKVKF